jgi:RNA polymerase sigma factor (sigma-70 family)
MADTEHQGYDGPEDLFLISSANVTAYIQSIGKYENLTKTEECTLADAWQHQGDHAARRKLILHNLRYVVYIAKGFVAKDKRRRLEDLIGAGNVGLVKATNQFDTSWKVKFISYAHFWIRNFILEFLEKGQPSIRIPPQILKKLRRFHKTEKQLRASLGHAPSYQELAEALDTTIDVVKELATMPNQNNIISLDQPLSEHFDGPKTVHDLIADDSLPDILHEVDLTELTRELYGFFKTLTYRERTVLRLRFGLGNQREPMDRGQIGERIGLSCERVRQIEEGALTKARRYFKGRVDQMRAMYLAVKHQEERSRDQRQMLVDERHREQVKARRCAQSRTTTKNKGDSSDTDLSNMLGSTDRHK